MHQERQLIDRVAQEYRIVSAIISVLNVELFGEFLFSGSVRSEGKITKSHLTIFSFQKKFQNR